MPTVLVLDGGSGPALAIVRSLGRAGWRVLVPAGTRSARSRFAGPMVDVPDAAREPDRFRQALADALAAERVDVVAPCTDASAELVWDVVQPSGGTRVLGGDHASFELARDKRLTLAAADGHGFPTPSWAAPATLAEAEAELARIGLPAVVKPRRSYVRRDGRLLHRRHRTIAASAELAAAFEAGGGEGSEPPLLQQLVPGRALAVTAVVRDGRVLARAARETLSFDPVGGGTSVWKRTLPADAPGVEAATALLLAVGFEGLGELEYQLDGGGVPRLMEIGARAHGWLPLAVAAGVDLPLVAALALLGEPVEPRVGWRAGVEMRWPSGELARVRAALARDPSLPPGVSRADVLARAWPPWRPGMRYDGIDLADPGPWLPQVATRARQRRGPR